MNNTSSDEQYMLRLYVAGMTTAAKNALHNIEVLCEERLQGQYSIEVVDLLEKPALAEGDQILAVPTLVRRLPPPMRKIIGDLSDTEKLLVGLDLKLSTPKQSVESHNQPE